MMWLWLDRTFNVHPCQHAITQQKQSMHSRLSVYQHFGNKILQVQPTDRIKDWKRVSDHDSLQLPASCSLKQHLTLYQHSLSLLCHPFTQTHWVSYLLLISFPQYILKLNLPSFLSSQCILEIYLYIFATTSSEECL